MTEGRALAGLALRPLRLLDVRIGRSSGGPGEFVVSPRADDTLVASHRGPVDQHGASLERSPSRRRSAAAPALAPGPSGRRAARPLVRRVQNAVLRGWRSSLPWSLKNRQTGRVHADAPDTESRDLTPDERDLLAAMLTTEFPGVAPFRGQATTVRAKPSCACGCGSIYLVEHAPGTLVEDQPLLSPIVRASGLRRVRRAYRTCSVYQRRGLLYEMETFAYTETQLPIPNPRSARMLPPEPVAPHRDATVIRVSQRWPGDDGDDGPGGVREPRRPIGPKPGESAKTIDD